MIISLSIENFALIEKLSIDFSGGFSIITGETGAGKSILLGALGLALGKRADLTALKNKNEKCIIEAQFNISDYNLQSFFTANDLDYESETIIRREILPSGKSRSFINDSPVNLQELQELGNYLIDIHSQHETRALSEGDFQFRIIDSMAGNDRILTEYSDLLTQYKTNRNLLIQLKDQYADTIKQQDYNNFLLDELLAAQLKPGDHELLEIQFEKLNNVEFIKESLDKSISLANEDQFGVLNSVKELKSLLQKVATFSPEYQSLFDRVQSVHIEIGDIVGELAGLSENLYGDPQELDRINQKLQTIYTLQKKHQVASVDALIEIQNQLDDKALSVSALESQIAETENNIAAFETQMDSLAGAIHQNRITAVPVLSEKLSAVLRSLGMPDARFQIEITAVTPYFHNGKDELEFFFSANKGSAFGPLKKIASGGEMSRIMLAVKSILAQYSELPTIIFDEIDTGVSGEIANKMGDIMKGMSATMQVFAITHLPQIAAKGEQHFKVFKYAVAGKTESKLQLLSSEERVTEIAQMLSGSTVSDSAINHAKALLE